MVRRQLIFVRLATVVASGTGGNTPVFGNEGIVGRTGDRRVSTFPKKSMGQSIVTSVTGDKLS